jgi:hypothetical protein
VNGARAGNGASNTVSPANPAGAGKASPAPNEGTARSGNTHRKSARAEPKGGGSSTAPGAEGQAPKAGTGKAQDRLELDTTQITGNRELPKVLYIVPWKRSDLGDLVGKPVNTLLDEVLEPVDRDVFKRENRYYDALKPDQTKPGTVTVEGSGDKR